MHASTNNRSWTIALLNDCHGMALTHLRPHLDKLFRNSDLTFLEFAEKAETEASQIRFMEALSVIQKNRTHIEEVFLREIGKGFSEFGNHVVNALYMASSADQPLSLVSKEDTDIHVAIQNMIGSASLGSTLTLSALRKRLAVLNNARMPEEGQIPAGPVSLANAFHRAVKDINLEHETRLLIYLLFDRFVLGKIRPLYDQYNQHLVKSGILPHLKYEAKKHPVSTQARQRAGQTETGGTADWQHAGTTAGNSGGQPSMADELFNDILGLLSRHARTADSTDSTRKTANGNSGGGHTPQPATQHTELITEIHKLQNSRRTDAPTEVRTAANVHGPEQHAQLISSMIVQLGSERDLLFRGIDRRRLPSADTQIIDLVGMMFEFMLRDKGIPSIAKAELSRLHTPYLKIAILDKGLFSDTTHPAHILLNRLASAAARWVFEDNLERGIFPCLHNIVQRIIEEFHNNLDIFPELLEVLETTQYNLEGTAAAIEESSRQAAKGKEKLDMARALAVEVIEECMSGHSVPDRLRSLLHDIWTDKLTFIYLREPDAEESTSWRLATQTIEAIIWSAEPRDTNKQRKQLRKRLPDLRKQITRSLETLGVYGNSSNEAQLTLISELQDAALQKTARQHESRPGEGDSETQNTAATTAAAAENTEKEHAEEGRRAKTVDDTEARLSPEEESALSQLEQVAFGSWFIIQEYETAPPQHVKLSWYSRISGNYMFVDSMGVRVMTRRHHELATLLATGKAEIVEKEQQPFMQRTLEKIRQVLGDGKTVPA
jgi:hypothetical protein